MEYQIPHLVQRGGGAIVNISSGAGVRAVPELAAYTAAEFRVVRQMQAVALEYVTQNIRINAICPGNIDTSMMERVSGGTKEGYQKVISQDPVGRIGRPEEIAAAALYLCSEAAGLAVVLAMSVDGGQSVGLN
jgi:NAD(P)-dependent dehydrogenase (short-subunit alcohol dehydrogenase family)